MGSEDATSTDSPPIVDDAVTEATRGPADAARADCAGWAAQPEAAVGPRPASTRVGQRG